ncbi:MAG: MotA/TolQ/ExbB proton channel family protein [Elusimicrobiales bacterium]|nr:MotA/TolQ/ExbB proton channel family protein [Elusimicrobiales bacterium]
MTVNVIGVLKGSFTLTILLFCSILVVAFAIERWFAFKKAKTKKVDDLIASIKNMVEEGHIDNAKKMTEKIDTPIGRVFTFILNNISMRQDVLAELVATKHQEEKAGLDKYLGVIGTMGNIAPFIGLFGTVLGIITAFRDLAVAGVGGPQVVARGISEALVATAGGLAVAIPSVILYNYFVRKLKTIMTELEIYSDRLIIILKNTESVKTEFASDALPNASLKKEKMDTGSLPPSPPTQRYSKG